MQRWWQIEDSEWYWLEVTWRGNIGAPLVTPQLAADGRTPWHWQAVAEAEDFDVVFHYDQNEQAITHCSGIAGPCTTIRRKGEDWWRRELRDTTPVTPPVTLEDLQTQRLVRSVIRDVRHRAKGGPA